MALSAILIENLNGFLMLGVPSESIALLMFGVGLVGVTAAMRRVLKRRDERLEDEN